MRRAFPQRVATWTGVALLGSIAVPWFFGTDDGRSLVVAGWDTEPGFALGMLACGVVMTFAGMLRSAVGMIVAALGAVGLTLWMLPRGERYSGYDLGPGPFLALAVAAFAVILVLRVRLGRDRM